jgi:uncharacterized coiled-coil protein SlyX
MVFGLKEEDDNMSKIDEDMIMVIAGKIITERMDVLEHKMKREFDAKLNILMEEQHRNKGRIETLDEIIVKQKKEIAKLQNLEEMLNLQRQEITALNEIVNEMNLRWDKNRQDTMLVKEQYYGHENPVLENQQKYQDKNTLM